MRKGIEENPDLFVIALAVLGYLIAGVMIYLWTT